MKKIFLVVIVVIFLPAYSFGQGQGSFTLIDWFDNKVVVLDFTGTVLMEKDFNGIGCPYFISPYLGGWLVKGCEECFGCTADNWFIWKLRPDGSIENTFAGVSPGPFYTGITSGNFIAGDVYTGSINLCDANGAIIDSINVWEEENGWSYEYSRLGDIAGLVGGGFVVPPQGGWPSIAQLYTPFLYYYDNDLTLVNKVDITAADMRLLKLTGLSDGGFVGTCADHGTGYEVEYLCWFNPDGEMIGKTNVAAELPFRQYMNVFIAGLSDGRAAVTVFGYDTVWMYDPPSAVSFAGSSGATVSAQAALDGPEVLDLSGAGITAIGGIAGNTFTIDTDADDVPDVADNCPQAANPGQEDIDGDGIGNVCDSNTTSSINSSTTTTEVFYDCMLTIYISPPEGGTTSPPPPQHFIQGCLDRGFTIEAIANPGYVFSHWEGVAEGSENPLTMYLNGGGSITAVFVREACPAESIYGNHSRESELLRHFRDRVLSRTSEGRELIKLYYQLSPAITAAMEEDEVFKGEVQEAIDDLLPLIQKMVK